MDNKTINPCYDFCYLRYKKEYTPDCDNKCDYAKAVKENKELQRQIDSLIGGIDVILDRED